MSIVIILKTDNLELLRFTETKVFFDAKNQNIDMFTDCFIVESIEEIQKYTTQYDSIFVIQNGYFLTTTFRKKYKDFKGVFIVENNDPDVIYFDPKTQINFKKRADYPSGSKQLYIIENMLQVVINYKKMIYFDNTEDYNYKNYDNIENLYGLASGWKTIRFARDIGLKKLKSITVYDYNPTQLEYAKLLHTSKNLPNSTEKIKNKVGDFNIPYDISEFWSEWHNYPVQFKLIDLYETPVFEKNSLVWISNAFRYEPNIWNYGWQECKNRKNKLIFINPTCIITEK